MMDYHNSYNVNVENAFWKLIMLFPLTTLVQKYLSVINQILFIVVFAAVVYLLFCKPIKREVFGLLVIVIANHLWALAYTVFPVKNGNTLYYYAFWILYYSMIITRREGLRAFIYENERYICSIIKLASLMILVSMLLPSSYEGGYFESFTGNSARTCPVAVFLLTLILVAVKSYKRKQYLYFAFFPMYCFFNMFYVYMCALLAYPIMLIAIDD